MKNRIRVVDYKGTKIVVQDFSKMGKDEVPRLLADSKKLMAQHPKGSVLVATNLRGITFDRELILEFLKTVETNKSHVRRSVFYGVENHQKEALKQLSEMAQRHFVHVATEEDALEHLIYS